MITIFETTAFLLLEKAKADDQIKLGVMSTLLDDLKTKEELIKRKKKLN